MRVCVVNAEEMECFENIRPANHSVYRWWFHEEHCTLVEECARLVR